MYDFGSEFPDRLASLYLSSPLGRLVKLQPTSKYRKIKIKKAMKEAKMEGIRMARSRFAKPIQA